MRKLTFLFIVLGALMVSCAKDETTSESSVDNTMEPTEAEVVEGIMTKSLSQLDVITDGESKSLGIVDYLLTDLIPTYGVSTIIKPLYSQIKDCYVDDTLTVGLNNLSGHFTAAFNRWIYKSADNLMFTFPWKNGEKVDYSILCSEELTESPIFHMENVFITLPREIQTSTKLDEEHLARTLLTSNYSNDGEDIIGDFKVKGNLLDSLSSEGYLSFSIYDGAVISCEFEYSVIDKEGGKPVVIVYEDGITGVDKVTITMDGRLRFEMEAFDIPQLVVVMLLGNSALKDNPSASNVEYYREMVAEFNEQSNIHFYLDGVLTGKVTLEVLEDNGTYAVDLVMAYDKDDSRYEIHGIYSGINTLVQRASSLISIIKDLFDLIIEQQE